MMTVDYVVVGGGITGVCTAYHLAKRGCEVLLIERDQLAPDAPISSSGEHAKAFRTAYGTDRKMTRLCVESFRLWQQFEQEAGTELFVPSGMLVFGADRAETLARWTTPAHARFATDSAATLKAEGLDHELLNKSELVERYPQIAANAAYDHAILDQTAGVLHARKAVREIGVLAEKAGATLWARTLVEQCVRRGDNVERLVTSRGDVVPRKAVIFAAGYMNSVLAPDLRPKTRVTQHQIVYVKPRDPALFAPARFPIVINLNQWRYVFPLHGPGITKVVDDDKHRPGAVIEPTGKFTKDAGDGFRASARTFLQDYVPGLLDAEEVDSATCRYTNTAQDKYLIYRKGNTVVLSACSGHGFKNAPMTARMAATLAAPHAEASSQPEKEFAYEHADNF
jgi:sarcosine oxidase